MYVTFFFSTAAKLADGAVTAGKLADGSVVAGKLAGGSVTTEKLANNAVTGSQIAPASVGFDKLAPNAAVENLSSSGGVVISRSPNESRLLNDGYQQTITIDQAWRLIPDDGDNSPGGDGDFAPGGQPHAAGMVKRRIWWWPWRVRDCM